MIKLSLLSGMAVFALGCSTIQPIGRETVASNMKPVLEIEDHAGRLIREQQMLAFSGWMEEAGDRAFKSHYDVYYVYHAAAVSHLAHGEISLYRQCVKLAQSELDALKQILDLSQKKASKELRPFRLPPQRSPEKKIPPAPSSGDST